MLRGRGRPAPEPILISVAELHYYRAAADLVEAYPRVLDGVRPHERLDQRREVETLDAWERILLALRLGRRARILASWRDEHDG